MKKESLLQTLIPHAYTRSALMYQVGLLKEFFEYVFFTKHQTTATHQLISDFGATKNKTADDLTLLRRLPVHFFERFREDSFYDLLEELSEDIEELEILMLTVPVAFGEQKIAEIGKWVRSELDQNLLLNVEKDSSIAVGCQFVWNDMFYDFSLTRYFEQNKKTLHDKLKLPEFTV